MIENNKAIVTRITVHPHPNADRLQLGYCFGNQLIVGLDTKDGDLGIYFPTELQLSQEFCEANDLIRRKDEDGKPAGGMFDDNRKVRCQKFRGEKSEGFFAPLSYLQKMGLDTSGLKESDCFDTLQGKKICWKFISKATRRGMSSKKNHSKRGETEFFKQHFDTPQFRMNFKEFRAGDLITISCKIHGCATRSTLVQTSEHGELTIGEIVDRKLPVHILAYDVEKQEKVWANVDAHYFKPDDGEWYEVEMEDGRTIQITGNNPVWVADKKRYVRVDELSIGDNILVDSEVKEKYWCDMCDDFHESSYV